ncbi:hypothetical protein ACS0TY_003129 [Phlomoides rotata]
MEWKLCPRIQKILERNMEKVANCIHIKSIDIHYQVRWGQYTVDLQHYTCTCKACQLSGILYTHALCAILSEDLAPEDFVHQLYTIDMYKVAYECPIYGINYDALWGESLYIPPLPPNFGRKSTKGKKVKKRRRQDGERRRWGEPSNTDSRSAGAQAAVPQADDHQPRVNTRAACRKVSVGGTRTSNAPISKNKIMKKKKVFDCTGFDFMLITFND